MVAWRIAFNLAGWGLCCLALGTQPVLGQTYPLAESPRPDECFKLELTTSVKGAIIASSGDHTVELPMMVTNRIDVLLRTLVVKDDRAVKTACYYPLARSTVSIRGETFRKVLSDERRLIVAQMLDGQMLHYSPKGPLTGDELDLVSDHFDVLNLSGLLPGTEVEIGQEWEPNKESVQALCSFDGLISHSLKGKLTEVKDGTAWLAITGKVSGIEAGALVNLTVTAKAGFDLLSNRITSVEWTHSDARDAGPVSPRLRLESTTKVERVLLKAEPKELSEVALVGVPKEEPPMALRQVRFVDPRGRYKLLHDREWNIVSQSDDHVVMRLLDSGDFIAQATITAWRKSEPGKHLSPDQMKKLIADTPGWEMREIIEEGELPTDEPGRWIYRVAGSGTNYGVEVVQNFVAIAGPEGDQVIVTIITKPANVGKVGTRDLALVQAIQFGQ